MRRRIWLPTVVSEVEATVDPNLVLSDGLVLLGVYRPLARQRDLFFGGCRGH
jgi:hypothetical protein